MAVAYRVSHVDQRPPSSLHTNRVGGTSSLTSYPTTDATSLTRQLISCFQIVKYLRYVRYVRYISRRVPVRRPCYLALPNTVQNSSRIRTLSTSNRISLRLFSSKSRAVPNQKNDHPTDRKKGYTKWPSHRKRAYTRSPCISHIPQPLTPPQTTQYSNSPVSTAFLNASSGSTNLYPSPRHTRSTSSLTNGYTSFHAFLPIQQSKCPYPGTTLLL